ncbi:MAG: MBL fold metallo-hydrolase, partial [Muribaculaceae bacterium]|nr:MBL fold metallo-hydrolase [Muribaculaceae bacterium]
LMIESNYDSSMLEHGRYPEMLKDRVRGERGHLDNEVAAHFVTEHLHPGLRHLFLCHLSKDNNTEPLALTAMRQALEQRGLTVGDGSYDVSQRDRDVQIYALPRYISSSWFVLA